MDVLLRAIEQYFQGGVEDVEARVHQTKLPPIYFQHPGMDELLCRGFHNANRRFQVIL